MKNHPHSASIVCSLTFLTLLTLFVRNTSAAPLGTAFTYQGRLDDNNAPANGYYDFRFAVFEAGWPPSGSPVGAWITNSAVAVSNGLFTTTLNFGNGVFDGSPRWLEIWVRTNWMVPPPEPPLPYNRLLPRQALTPAPYALYASGAHDAVTSQVARVVAPAGVGNIALADGAVTAAKIAGGNVVKSLNTLKDDVTLAAGANVTLTPGGQTLTLSSPTDWHSGGNSGTTPGTHFLGTTDNQPLEFKVNGQRALRLEPNSNSAPNVVAGSPLNWAGPLAFGATIAGGGGTDYYGVTGSNVVVAPFSTVGGGNRNRIQGYAPFATIAGGDQNLVEGGAIYGAIGGGSANTLSGNGSYMTVAGGANNWVETDWSAIGGGRGNQVMLDGRAGVIGGGFENRIEGAGAAVIGGGSNNVIEAGAAYATIAGGVGNVAGGAYATVSGGDRNVNRGEHATLGGGWGNFIQTNAGGAFLGGGGFNSIQTNAFSSFLGGGWSNSVSGHYGVVPGGDLNRAGTNSFAAGHRAKAGHTGAFVWADMTESDFATTADKQFLIRASGGVGIGTNNPQTTLHVNGIVTATGFSGSGGGLTGISTTGLADNSVTAAKLASDAGSLAKVTAGNMISSGSAVSLTVNEYLNDKDIYLRNNQSHGLGWYGGSKGFGGLDVNGPVLYGGEGGALGTVVPGVRTNIALYWNINSDLVLNPGEVDNGGGGPALRFGWSSGEWITSKRGPGGSQYGIDFYTGFTPRLSINRSGNVGIGKIDPATALDVNGTVTSSSLSGSGTNALDILVNGSRALRLEPTAHSPNVIGGYSGNVVSNGFHGAVIGGGGNSVSPNRVGANYATVVGGEGNTASGDYSTAMGGDTTANGRDSTAMGGGTTARGHSSTAMGDSTTANGDFSTAMGFASTASGTGSTAMGWYTTADGENSTAMGADTSAISFSSTAMGFASGASGFSSTAMGFGTGASGDSSTAMGSRTTARGGSSTAMGDSTTANGDFSTAMGYYSATANAYTMAAGRQAKAIHQGAFVWADSEPADFASTATNQFLIRASGGVGINKNNPTTALDVNGIVRATAFEGQFTSTGDLMAARLNVGTSNILASPYATIAGGSNNVIQANASFATVAGGMGNLSGAWFTTVGGGGGNVASNDYATVSGGAFNTATGNGSAVPGGYLNLAAGLYSFAAGQQAKAQHDGTFVWADATAVDFPSTADNQFLIRASGGVGINKNNPATALDVNGTVTASSVGIGTVAPGIPLSFASVNGDKISLYGNAGNSYGFGVQAYQLQIHTDGSAADVLFGYGPSTNFVETMRIKGTGNVGINNNHPTTALDVTGTVTATSFTGSGAGLTGVGTVNLANNAVTSAKLASDTASLSKVSGGKMTCLAGGNVGIGTNSPQSKLHVVGDVVFTSGAGFGANQSVAWAPGSGSWTFTSDRHTKENLAPVDRQLVLEKVASLPLSEWSYIGYAQRHIGPMAQDFHALFPLNESDTTLNDADLHGVALAALQGLNQKLNEELKRRDADNAELKARLERLEQLIIVRNGGAK